MTTNNEMFATEINQFKDTVAKLNGTYDELDALDELKEHLDYIIELCSNSHKAYFISVNDIGPDDDFIRVYTPIGFVTRSEALAKCMKLSGEDGYGENDILEVDKETYDMYIEWRQWYDLAKQVRFFHEAQELIPYDSVKNKVDEIKAALGLGYRWEIPGSWY